MIVFGMDGVVAVVVDDATGGAATIRPSWGAPLGAYPADQIAEYLASRASTAVRTTASGMVGDDMYERRVILQVECASFFRVCGWIHNSLIDVSRSKIDSDEIQGMYKKETFPQMRHILDISPISPHFCLIFSSAVDSATF